MKVTAVNRRKLPVTGVGSSGKKHKKRRRLSVTDPQVQDEQSSGAKSSGRSVSRYLLF